MPRATRGASAALMCGALATAGCGSSESAAPGGVGGAAAPTCTANTTQACLCVGVGSGGVQPCKADGSGWEVCACPDSGAGGSDGGDAAADAVADVAQDVSVDTPIDALADGTSDAADAGDVSIDAVADASTDAIPDGSQDVVGDLPQETTVDASLDVPPDAVDAADATFDVSQDVVADVAQDVFVGVCTPAEKRCGGPGSLQPQECDATGQWQSLGAACPFECIRTGTCTPPSCAGGGDGLTNCGPSANESCCTSPLVTGGTVQLDSTHAATVSDYKLDKYEITVGRFRKFVDAVVAGWTPAAGAGKHTHLNGGSGLSNGSGGYEPGWDATWPSNLPMEKATWDSNLSCYSTYQTWTSAAGGNEQRPINCTTWFETAAFCIWDGGFLPSEAEWQYAAAGGSEGRQYPWSVPASSTTIDDTLAVYCGASCSAQNVGSKPAGNGKWGQSDLAGNVWEWTLDWHWSPYDSADRTNHANVTTSVYRVLRGGSFFDGAMVASFRYNFVPSARYFGLGARCARTP